MFRRRKDEASEADKLRDIIDFLKELEPKQMDRLVALAKEQRVVSQKIDAFVGINSIKAGPALEFEEIV